MADHVRGYSDCEAPEGQDVSGVDDCFWVSEDGKGFEPFEEDLFSVGDTCVD